MLESENDLAERDVKQLCGLVRGDVANLTAKHKSLHGPVSKIGKLIDKQFDSSDFNPVGVAKVFDAQTRHSLVKAMVNHLYCSGKMLFQLKTRFYSTLGMSHVAAQLEVEAETDAIGIHKRNKTKELARLIDDTRHNQCREVCIFDV